jgi:hypothetical protein
MMSLALTPAPAYVGRLLVLCAAGAAALVAAPASLLHAQQSSLRGQQTVEFRTSRAATLPLKVGPVAFSSVEFSDLGRGSGRGGFGSVLRSATSASEASTTLRAHFLAENPTAEEWEVTIAMEFLDKAGKVIEKTTRKASWEGEAKPYNFDTEILEYVVPLIARVRITLEARYD